MIDWRTLTLTTNRAIKDANVRKICRSINEHGYIPWQPLIVNTRGEILDGQHRWAACVELGVEPTIQIVDSDVPVELIMSLNAVTHHWTTADMVEFYARCGNDDAQFYVDTSKKYGVMLDAVLVACGKSGFSRGREMPTTSPDERTSGITVLDEMGIFEVVCAKRASCRTRSLVRAYRRIRVLPKFSYERFCEKIETYGREKFILCTNTAAQIRNLIDLYNYRTPDRARLPFPSDTHRSK